MRGKEREEALGPYNYPIEHQINERHSNVAVLLPGQDVRKPGMFDEIAQHPAGQEVIERADRFLEKEFGYKISEIAAKDADPAVVRRTEHTQPAVFTLSVGLHNVNKYHRKKDGYVSLPRYLTGNSQGMGTAAYLGGAIDNFEEALWISAMRGKVMQKYGDPTPTSMVAVITTREVIDEMLERYPDLDLCLINDNSVFVIGGPSRENPDDPLQMQKAISELTDRKIRSIPVDTDRAMHGRYVRGAKPKFSEVLHQVHFKTPIIPLVGTHTGFPIRDRQGIIEELEYGFDNTFDNTKPLRFFDEAKVHLISEVNERGTFGKIMERSFGAVATHRLETALGVGVLAAGIGIYEVFTRHHPNNKKTQ